MPCSGGDTELVHPAWLGVSGVCLGDEAVRAWRGVLGERAWPACCPWVRVARGEGGRLVFWRRCAAAHHAAKNDTLTAGWLDKARMMPRCSRGMPVCDDCLDVGGCLREWRKGRTFSTLPVCAYVMPSLRWLPPFPRLVHFHPPSPAMRSGGCPVLPSPHPGRADQQRPYLHLLFGGLPWRRLGATEYSSRRCSRRGGPATWPSPWCTTPGRTGWTWRWW